MEIIEVIFEGVNTEKAIELIKKLGEKFEINKINGDVFLSKVTLDESIKIANGNNSYAIYYEFDHIKLKEVEFKKLGVHIHKYIDSNDELIFAFSEEDCKKVSFDIFKNINMEVLRKVDAIDCFCGLEPAFDENTQFFSKYGDGPLKWY